MKTKENINRRGKASISSLNLIKKGCKGGGYHHRRNHRIGVLGVYSPYTQRCILGHIPNHCNPNNILVTHPIKIRLWLQ